MRIRWFRSQSRPSRARRGRWRGEGVPRLRVNSRVARSLDARSSCVLHWWRQREPAQRTSPSLQDLSVYLNPDQPASTPSRGDADPRGSTCSPDTVRKYRTFKCSARASHRRIDDACECARLEPLFSRVRMWRMRAKMWRLWGDQSRAQLYSSITRMCARPRYARMQHMSCRRHWNCCKHLFQRVSSALC